MKKFVQTISVLAVSIFATSSMAQSVPVAAPQHDVKFGSHIVTRNGTKLPSKSVMNFGTFGCRLMRGEVGSPHMQAIVVMCSPNGSDLTFTSRAVCDARKPGSMDVNSLGISGKLRVIVTCRTVKSFVNKVPTQGAETI